jgi:maltose alpha-D-glucosyltransferase/alpha-amylase
VLPTDHESVLAFVREYPGSGNQFGDLPETVLCVFSFSHNPATVQIQAADFAGQPLRDLFGGGDFPVFDDEGRVTLTIGTQGFYWLHVGNGHYTGGAR